MKLAASLSDPRQQLQLITWNVGSFARHRTDILGVLAATAPHIFCLQECPLGNSGGINALRADMRPLGYVVHSSGNLVVLAKRGLNIAPIRSLAGDDDFRMQRFVLLVGSTRIRIRHRHAPSDGPSNRRVLNNLLAAEPMGDLVIDIGDFNEYPSASPGRCILFPDGFTYWHQPRNDANCTSTLRIDGAVVSDLPSHETSADVVPTRALTQHSTYLCALQWASRRTSTSRSDGWYPILFPWVPGPTRPPTSLHAYSRLTLTPHGHNGWLQVVGRSLQYNLLSPTVVPRLDRTTSSSGASFVATASFPPNALHTLTMLQPTF